MTPLAILAATLLLFVLIMLGLWLAGAKRRGDVREIRRLHALLWLISALTVLGFTGCSAARPKVPQQVIVTVEKFKPLPAWAKPQLQKAMPVDGTVGARNRAYEQRGGTIDYANCIFHLLTKLDLGEPVDANACAHE